MKKFVISFLLAMIPLVVLVFVPVLVAHVLGIHDTVIGEGGTYGTKRSVPLSMIHGISVALGCVLFVVTLVVSFMPPKD